MAALGTTATELKSGYGLSVDAELRQLRLARRLAEAAPQTCRVTLLACHAVPDGWSREDWVRAACEELIPAAAAEGLADAVDIYVEDIAFSLEDLERVAAAASAAGLPLRVHADQLGPSGAAEAAAALGARSADHLNHLSADGIAALGAGRDGGGPVAGLDVHPPGGAGARRCAPGRRRRPRDRDRPEPRHLAHLLDARDDRVRLLALRDDPARGPDRGHREPRVGARPR